MNNNYKSFTAKGAKILAVDDNRMNLDVFTGLLKHIQMDITAVMSGKEALEKLCEKKYDIIFMDHMMPVMDGIEVFNAAKTLEGNLNLGTPYIMLTANAVIGAREQYLSLGFTDYISKPINASALEEMIYKYLPGELISEDVKPVQAAEHKLKKTSGLYELIDRELALSHCMDDESLLEEILISYAEDDRRKRLQKSFVTMNFHDYQVDVHSVKSTSLTIGATELSAKAKALETAAKEENGEYITDNHGEMMVQYSELIEAIKAEFGK